MHNLSIKKKVKLIYPPSPLYQRGEDRCQANIEASTATSIRACNDLGYAASSLLKIGCDVLLKDYQTEKLSVEILISDLNLEKPDVLFVSVTNGSIYNDLKIIQQVKSVLPSLIIILKGALFFNPQKSLFEQLDLSNVDYLVGGESEFIISDLIYSHFEDYNNIPNIKGISYKKDNNWIINDFDNLWVEDIDSIPFPAREMMNNSLYVRPDTNEVQATISTSRGCPSSCIFCLTPYISGKKLRLRHPELVFQEIEECYLKFGIKNFFFKADTFTFNKEWTLKLCDLIINSSLYNKISWVANSRVVPIDLETLQIMKKAGCWLVAFGFESGSQKSLDLMKKGTTVEQNISAMRLAKKAGLKVFGFFMIGFPWEDLSDLKKTRDLIFKLDADFIELHLATPFYGTQLYDIALKEKLIDESVLGKDYFNAPTIPTKKLFLEQIQKYRKSVLLSYHLRPIYILKKLIYSFNKPKVILNYFSYGFNLLKNCLIFK